ncbi:MAG: 23S rRNA (guanosine(2251)-2'-O)-methyltransferase RlmB [Saprospiraceae bacterium]|nr:23S rRNA (guanosine(2251)-2'-O)-methyltransferase RlmB [Saprospiraceae bacterium]
MNNQSTSYIYGRQPVLEALKSKNSIEKIFLLSGGDRDFEKEIRNVIKSRNIDLAYVPREKLNRLVNGNHQGVVAYINDFEYSDLDHILQKIKAANQVPFLIMLDQMTDVRNFGAIARSALLGGCHGIIIPASNSVSVTSDAMKASAGALAHIPVCKVNSLADAADHLAEQGIQLFVSGMNKSVYLHELNLNEACCIVMGSEKTGVSRPLESRADAIFSIPQNDKLDSYNVSVACGIIIYQTILKRNFNQ